MRSSSRRLEIILSMFTFYGTLLHLVKTLFDWLTVLRDTFCLNAASECCLTPGIRNCHVSMTLLISGYANQVTFLPAWQKELIGWAEVVTLKGGRLIGWLI